MTSRWLLAKLLSHLHHLVWELVCRPRLLFIKASDVEQGSKKLCRIFVRKCSISKTVFCGFQGIHVILYPDITQELA